MWRQVAIIIYFTKQILDSRSDYWIGVFFNSRKNSFTYIDGYTSIGFSAFSPNGFSNADENTRKFSQTVDTVD